MKQVAFLFCGLCWFAVGVAISIFAWRYLWSGANTRDSNFLFQIFTPVSPGNILIESVHVVGFFTLAVLCFAIGLWSCSFGSDLRGKPKLEPPQQP